MEKPEHTLSELEQEPIVFLGCTASEIANAQRKALSTSIGVSMIVSFLVYLLTNTKIPIIVIGTLLLLALSYSAVIYFTLKDIAGAKAGKPLFYDQHIRKYRNPKIFIQPQQLYQRHRNVGRK